MLSKRLETMPCLFMFLPTNTHFSFIDQYTDLTQVENKIESGFLFSRTKIESGLLSFQNQENVVLQVLYPFGHVSRLVQSERERSRCFILPAKQFMRGILPGGH